MKPVDELLAERRVTHGAFGSHAEITQALKYHMHITPHWNSLMPYQKEALEMIVHKIGRVLNGRPDYKDHWDDIAGYAQLVSNILGEGLCPKS